MFTPQRKLWSGWTHTPRSDQAQKNGSGSDSVPNSIRKNDGTVAKGKSVAFVDSTLSPAVGFLGQNGEIKVAESKEAALDRQTVGEKILKLEKELFDYQYNMGILLIEKKELATKYDELKQALEEATHSLKREHAAHLIAVTDVEKREESLRKALGVEKQCVLDLEKSVRSLHSENAEIKFTGDSKLAEANALLASIEEKSLEVEAKLHAADAKLAEVSRKSSEIERKSHEVEIRENTIRRERLSFNAEREARESSISKQREDLRDWERKLKEGEERLDEVRRLLNQREERANENDTIFKQKQNDLEQAHKSIDVANSTLKSKEESISKRLDSLAIKEKEADAMRTSIDVKEKELLALEEKLDSRERVEIQKLLDEHKSVLDTKKQEFEIEMEQKRKSFDEDLKNKAFEVEKKEAEINHLEEKVAKREHAYEKRLEKLKEKEKDFESRSKVLKEREKTIKIDDKKLESERKQILVDKDNMLNLKTELEKIRDEVEEQKLKIQEEREHLQITEEERSDYLHLQSELKLEIDKCRQQRELLLKEGEELKQERVKFEREWEQLDEKRAEIKKELEDVIEQKEKTERITRLLEERLDNEKRSTQDYVQMELESLKLAKDSFAASMEHEKAVMDEKIQSEKSQMLNNFELRKRELEEEMQKKLEETENVLGERKKSFEEERERELSSINYLREVAQRETEEMKVERLRIEKEKVETAANQKHLEVQQLEMQRDIDDLVGLSKKLKEQREHFVLERERFIEFVGRHKDCQTCGEITREFIASDLRESLPIIDKVEPLSLPRVSDDYLEGNTFTSHQRLNNQMYHGSGSVAMSWLRKCTTKIFSLSPDKKCEISSSPNLIESPTRTNSIEQPVTLLSTENEPESFGIATNSLDGRRIQSGDDQSNINSNEQEIAENSRRSNLTGGRRNPSRKGRARVNKTRSVKKVVEEAKSILGDAFEQNDRAEDSAYMNQEGKQKNGQKRNRTHNSQNTTSEQDGGYSEGHSGSVRADGGPKRRQKVQVVQNPGELRYNLRRHRIPVATAAKGALPDTSKGKERDRDEISNSKAVAATSTEIVSANGGSVHFSEFGTTAGAEDDGNADTSNKLVVDDVNEEEVEETPESTPLGSDEGEDDDDDDGDDEASEHPGEVSIGKKLLKFLMS